MNYLLCKSAAFFRVKIKYGLILILFCPSIGFSNDLWLCKAHDNTNKEWLAQSPYPKIAINRSLDACKRQSTNPLSCRITSNDCESPQLDPSTKPYWRCTAIDQQGTPWNSIYYLNKEDAALAANAYCHSKSPLPETCFINMITCVSSNQND